MRISYNWLKQYIPDAPAADKLADAFTYHVAEVENVDRRSNDTVFEIKILPNRAHDLLSHQGIARELASLLRVKYVNPVAKYEIPESRPTNLAITVLSNKCSRYMGRIIRNVKIGPSPDWMVERLESIGQRSINNLVDAANLIMFDCGQPAHVFDLNKVEGGLWIREAHVGEVMITLDNKELKLRESDLVIADKTKVLGLAGIKGGRAAEVSDRTTDVIIEIANFNPVVIRKSGQHFSLFTDARKRFENELTPEHAAYAMRALSALILGICPNATFEDIVDRYPLKQKTRKLTFRVAKVSKILGLDVSETQVEDILKNYAIDYVNNSGVFEIVVPGHRLDLALEEDIAEEIGRILGYDKIPARIPKIDFRPRQNETHEKIKKSRQYLLSLGFNEVITYVFRDKGRVEVMQSASDKKFLREDIIGEKLMGGFEYSINLNSTLLPLLGIKNYLQEFKLFEIGTVWTPKEEIHVAYIDVPANKPEQEETLNEFYKKIPPNLKLESTKHKLDSKFQMWSLFPFIARDIAVWVPEGVTSEEVANLIRKNTTILTVRGPELFDTFRKNGKISYAFRVVFQSFERTLTDQEVNAIVAKIEAEIKTQKDWQVR